MTLTTETDKTYNGWVDYETWNAALWIGGDEGFYNFARNCRDYTQFMDFMNEIGSDKTPDGVKWTDADLTEMNEMIEEL